MALTQFVDDLPAKLQEALRAQQVTVSQAAGAAGVRREDVQEWLEGHARPTAVQLHDLAADLGVNVADFYVKPERGYQTHVDVGPPMQMKDYLRAQEVKQRQHKRELPALRE
jgi:transcriptional regulator with XRE-family HTH domain